MHPLLMLGVGLIVAGIVLSLVAMGGAIGTTPGTLCLLAGAGLGIYVKYVVEGKGPRGGASR
ncbi:MAG TPA: hypothetical protein PLL54_01045 [Dermatophilaceae bacterium]|nr:hypothetical protein [Dermatophilaceae bacterium]